MFCEQEEKWKRRQFKEIICTVFRVVENFVGALVTICSGQKVIDYVPFNVTVLNNGHTNRLINFYEDPEV